MCLETLVMCLEKSKFILYCNLFIYNVGFFHLLISCNLNRHVGFDVQNMYSYRIDTLIETFRSILFSDNKSMFTHIVL